MNKWKKVIHALLFLPSLWGIIIFVLSLFFVAGVFVLDVSETPIAYAAYLFSAYGLYVFIMSVIVPMTHKIIARLHTYKYIDRYFTDEDFHARVSLYRGAVFNVIYALFKLITGIVYRSFWIIAIAVYYIALCGIKYVLVKNDVTALRRKEANLSHEWKTYRKASVLLLLLNITLIGIIVQTVWKGQSYSYPGFFVFAMAFYAFYRIITASIRLVKDRSRHGPILSAAKGIDFTVALVAIFSLQTALLATYGGDNCYMIALFNSISGIAVSVIVLGIAVFMLVKAHKSLSLDRNGGSANE